jgi:nicotinamide-nucleotide adenylyltransferase
MAANPIQTMRTRYNSALKCFATSPKTVEILSADPGNTSHSMPKILYVFDSSFNPPTVAHLRIAVSALAENPSPSSRLLLLLATQNADKPSKPALFEDRLVMMTLFARDLRSCLHSLLGEVSARDHLPPIDIGVTKKPYFVDKAAAIEESGAYPRSLEQVHLTGYDTLIRIFDPKYYPPEHTLQPLEPFLSRHRLRVTMRPDDEWGSREEQEGFLVRLAQGEKEHEGARGEWASRIQLVKGRQEAEEAVSSTKARLATHAGLERLVPSGVRDYIISQGIYTEK